MNFATATSETQNQPKNLGQALQIPENKHFDTDMRNFGLKNFGLIFPEKSGKHPGLETPGLASGGVRVRFRVRFQMMKVPLFGGFPVENPTNKATASKLFLKAISLSEYGSEGFRVRLRSLSEYGSVAYLLERPTRETRTEQYSDTVL